MADVSKSQKLKLANSRKRFKELQELKKKRNDGKKLSESCENISNSDISLDKGIVDENVENNLPSNIQSPSYFSNTPSQTSECQEPILLFGVAQKIGKINQEGSNEDNSNCNVLSLSNCSPSQVNVQAIKSDAVVSSLGTSNEHVTEQYFIQEDFSLFPQEVVKSSKAQNVSDVLNDDNSEINQNLVRNSHPNSDNVFAMKNSTELLQYLQAGIKEEKCKDSAFKVENANSSEQEMEMHNSGIESLRQLSYQMVQLMEPEYCASSSITDLEKRNLELAAHLEQEKIKSEQQNSLINELQVKMSQLSKELQEKNDYPNVQAAHEVSRLKEELQCHIQTIGMLVAEKTEMAANLSQFEFCSKQKSVECEELQTRLKASRSHAKDLEKDNNSLKLERDQNKTKEQEQGELLDQLQKDCIKFKEEKEECMQDLLEIKEKLKNSLAENFRLQQQNGELSNKISLANIKIQQITGREQFEDHMEKITQEKFELERKILELHQMLKTITKDHEDSNLQYQQYSQQQNVQLATLSSKLEQLQLENDNLSRQEQNRIRHISELERQLQSLQTEQVTLAATITSNKDLEITKELCVQLQIEKTSLQETYMNVCNEKEMLLKELEAKSDSFAQLEDLVEQLRGNQPDSVKLLATMESNKVAAAKAVQQNKELKQQVDSMQEAFLKVNNDKVELTEQLSKAQNDNKELLKKLKKTELHLQRLTDAIEIKDHELFHLRENSTELNKQMLQHEQLSDRLRHYEAQDNSSFAIQSELEEAKQIIIRLTNELNTLKQSNNVNENTNTLVQNWDGLLRELKDNQDTKKHDYVENDSETNLQKDDNCNEHHKLDKEIAMRYLEEKFKHTMQDIADLTEEKQRLEHLVMQLQSETETIGEYVALYQHQRMVLKQKALEKDQQLKQLASDREQIKNKLEKLSELIEKLVDEKELVSAELFQRSENTSAQTQNYCEESFKETHSIGGNTSVTYNISENSKTAEEIVDLLLEIKSSNLVQPNENVHHCPWCSGQLITV